MKKIAIVTDNLNRHLDTLELLSSINQLDSKKLDLLTIVVDKTPNDWFGDQVDSKKYPRVEVLQAGSNNGFSGGNNLGIRYALAWGAEFVLIINNDTLIKDKLFLKKLLEVFDSHPEAVVVSPKIYFAPGFEFQKARYQPVDSGRVIWYAGGHFDWANVQAVHHGIDEVDYGGFDQIEETGYVTGCCLLVKSEVFEKIGFFKEEYFAYFEDAQWQQRILNSGGRLWYCGSTHIFHKTSQTLGIGSPLTDYLLTRNRLYFTSEFASLRTKFAVFRQMLGLVITGRPAQKQGILDFVRGRTGPGKYLPPAVGEYRYPKRLSIIISVYKTSQLTGELLRSIFNSKSGFDDKLDEVIVLDDASDDNCASVIAKFPQVRFLQNRINRGFVAGNNRLMEYSRGEMVLMFNTDIEVKPGSLTSLVKTCRQYRNQAVLGGNLYFPDGTPQDCCFNLPTITGAIKEYLFKQQGSYFMYRPDGSNPTRVEGAVMAVFLIPKQVLYKIGYLNRKLVMYFEDIDYCRRLKQAGIPVMFCPDAVFIHHHGAASKKMGKTVINERIIASAKIYHGKLYYSLLTATLWLVQKINLVASPKSKWIEDSNP